MRLSDEEDDECEEPTPVIRQNYFKEIYESECGKALKLYGAELDEVATCTDRTDREQQAENDEIEFIKEQRFCSKSNATRLKKQKFELSEQDLPEDGQDLDVDEDKNRERSPANSATFPEPVEQSQTASEQPEAGQEVSEGVRTPN